MKLLKSAVSVVLCLFMLTSCQSNAKNTKYFKDKIEQTDISESLRFYPELFSDYETAEDIRISVQNDSVSYSFKGSLTSKNKFEYQYITVNIQKQDKDISTMIESLVESYNEDGVTSELFEFDGNKHAVSYEIILDRKFTVVNVIYPVSDYVSAFFAMEIKDLTEINESVLKKICSDINLIAI